MAHAMGYTDTRRKRLAKFNSKSGGRPVTYKHKYKNYKPFNPVEIKEKYLYANRNNKIDKQIQTTWNDILINLMLLWTIKLLIIEVLVGHGWTYNSFDRKHIILHIVNIWHTQMRHLKFRPKTQMLDSANKFSW